MIGNLNRAQVITQKYRGKEHRGVDLRSFDFEKGILLPIITPEDCKILRFGKDKYGNGFIVVRGMSSNKILKFIHVKYNPDFREEDFILKEEFIGYTEIAGNSRDHHLHFEVWKNQRVYEDPLYYFKEMNIPWRLKTGLK